MSQLFLQGETEHPCVLRYFLESPFTHYDDLGVSISTVLSVSSVAGSSDAIVTHIVRVDRRKR